MKMVNELGLKIRKGIIAACNKHPDLINQFDKKNLCGACGLASYILKDTLNKRYDKYPDLVYGKYEHAGYLWHHCWVEYQNQIIDLTATQFKIFDEVYIVDNKNPLYRAELKNKDAMEFLSKWGGQDPKFYSYRWRNDKCLVRKR